MLLSLRWTFHMRPSIRKPNPPISNIPSWIGNALSDRWLNFIKKQTHYSTRRIYCKETSPTGRINTKTTNNKEQSSTRQGDVSIRNAQALHAHSSSRIASWELALLTCNKEALSNLARSHTSSTKSAILHGAVADQDAHLITHNESPSAMSWSICNLWASLSAIGRAIISALWTVQTPAGLE